MECPSCDSEVTPGSRRGGLFSRYRCGGCGAELRESRAGFTVFLISWIISGVFIAVTAVIMEWKEAWSSFQTMLYFIVVIPLYTIHLSLVHRKYAHLTEVEENKS